MFFFILALASIVLMLIGTIKFPLGSGQQVLALVFAAALMIMAALAFTTPSQSTSSIKTPAYSVTSNAFSSNGWTNTIISYPLTYSNTTNIANPTANTTTDNIALYGAFLYAVLCLIYTIVGLIIIFGGNIPVFKNN